MSESNVIEFPEPQEGDGGGDNGGWLSMDTAPCDGTLIWVFAGGKRFVAYYRQQWEWKKFRVVTSFHALWGPDGELNPDTSNPTMGWQPIPEPMEIA